MRTEQEILTEILTLKPLANSAPRPPEEFAQVTARATELYEELASVYDAEGAGFEKYVKCS